MSSFCLQETKYEYAVRTCRAAGLVEMTSLASFGEWEARISPSVAITLTLASLASLATLAASASVAMARWSCTGSRTSSLKAEASVRYLFGEGGYDRGDREYMNKYASAIVNDLKRLRIVLLR